MRMRVDFYTRDGLKQKIRANRIVKYILFLTAAASLVACVILCAKTTTLNAAAMEKAVLLTAVLSGWLVIALYVNVYEPGIREVQHASHLMDEEAQKLCGTLRLEKRTVQIRGSIRVRDAVLTTPDGEKKLLLNDTRTRLLKNVDGPIAVYTVGRYIVGYEREAL